MSNKTIGTTTAMASSGTVAGVGVATFLVEVTHWNLSSAGFGGLVAFLSLLGALLCGYLAPSKRAEADAYIASQTIEGVDPTSAEYATPAEAPASEYAPAHGSTAVDKVTAPDYVA